MKRSKKATARDYFTPFFVPGPDAWVIQTSSGDFDDADTRYFATEQDCLDAIDDKVVICPWCDGSGEGRYEGSVCSCCLGDGQL